MFIAVAVENLVFLKYILFVPKLKCKNVKIIKTINADWDLYNLE